jgi:queuine tRNA-ribosyltransferase
VKSVARGIDMFDCVMPTRSGRTASPSPGAARSTCATPAMPTIRAAGRGIDCPAARDYSRAYLHQPPHGRIRGRARAKLDHL